MGRVGEVLYYLDESVRVLFPNVSFPGDHPSGPGDHPA
eukprot:gene28838-23727_t